MIFTGTNIVGNDSYFIRLKDNRKSYMHCEGVGENPDDDGQVVWRLKEELKGAAIWHKKEAIEFIKHSGAGNLEIVKVKNVLGNDHSGN